MRKEKKSETVEVRISYDTKRRLVERAKRENTTVSEIIRRHIQDYLDKPFNPRNSNIWNHAINNVRIVLAGFAALILFSLSVFTPATADDVSLHVTGAVEDVESLEPLSVNKKSFETNLLIDEDVGDLELPLGHDSIKMRMLAMPTVLPDGREAVSIEISITERNQNGEDILIAKPKLLTVFDAPARIEIGSEPGRKFELTVLPRRAPK